MTENDNTASKVIQAIEGITSIYAKAYIKAYENMDFEACKLLNEAYQNQRNNPVQEGFLDFSQLPKSLDMILN